MYFAPIRKVLFPDRFPVVLSMWLLLWSFCLLLLIIVSLVVKLQLQEVERKDINSRLTSFLKQTSVYSQNLRLLEQAKGAGFLQGLDFLRLVKGSEQVLLTENNDSKIDFKKMTRVDPHESGVWVELGNLHREGDWVIVSQYHDPNVILQAGKKTSDTRRIYQQIRKFMIWASAVLLPFTFGLAGLLVKQGSLPIQKAHREIEAILSKARSEALLPENLTGELGKLYNQLNDLLRHNRKLIDEMQTSLDSVAHDLRTPMTRLRSVAEYGLQADSDPTRLSEALSDCLEEAERVLSMLNIMMSVAEAESGTMHLQQELFDVGKSIEGAIALYEYVAEEKKITVTSELAKELVLTGDKTRITQVWANLLDNALKYGIEGGFVHIQVKKKDRNILIVFQDNGMGISENEILRIWERFYRGDRSRTQQGLGLGLNYVRAVIEAHGGEVSVTSNLGEGSRFEVQLCRQFVVGSLN